MTEATPPENSQIPASGVVGDVSLGDQTFGFDGFGQIDPFGTNIWSDEYLNLYEGWMALVVGGLSDKVVDAPPVGLVTVQPPPTSNKASLSAIHGEDVSTRNECFHAAAAGNNFKATPNEPHSRFNSDVTESSHHQLSPEKPPERRKRLYVEISAGRGATKDGRGAITAKWPRLMAVLIAYQPTVPPSPSAKGELEGRVIYRPRKEPVRPQNPGRRDSTPSGDNRNSHGHGRLQEPQARPALRVNLPASRENPTGNCGACGFAAEHLLQLTEVAWRWVPKDNASFEALLESGFGFSDTEKSAVMLRLCLGSIRDYAGEMVMASPSRTVPNRHAAGSASHANDLGASFKERGAVSQEPALQRANEELDMTSLEKLTMPGDHIRFLAIDGGGVRGLSSLMILRRLMATVNPESPPKPREYFDMIGGTSTGGIIAVMLGRLRMTVDECIEAYTSLSDEVFEKKSHRVNIKGKLQGRFDTAELERAIKQILRDRGLSEETLLRDTDGPCKVFVCATSKQAADTVCLTSYPSRRSDNSDLLESTKIWQACRATSAATTFFDLLPSGRLTRNLWTAR
ncbi:hypothetical protein DL768_011033 [Monosporascus sp. mg162]|nr:hypothetical protein DL768_011033 [Monosporascus sp. mg162]